VRRIRPVRFALQNQRDDLLAFSGVLDAKLTSIAQLHALPEHLVRAACYCIAAEHISRILARMESATLQNERQIHAVFDAVEQAMHRRQSSSMVENLNSRLETILRCAANWWIVLEFCSSPEPSVLLRSRRPER